LIKKKKRRKKSRFYDIEVPVNIHYYHYIIYHYYYSYYYINIPFLKREDRSSNFIIIQPRHVKVITFSSSSENRTYF